MTAYGIIYVQVPFIFLFRLHAIFELWAINGQESVEGSHAHKKKKILHVSKL
jgi:hypothetical protein